ncbi:heterokaryon incompatibility protein-domain-containing protein [Astrocystis sublimbata]|nr:heterokaryon incompatibility protein-domain-containing protein [Astrocystis sublimbata]
MVRYQALDTSRNEIRVLRLYPTEPPNSEIYCTLENVSLDDHSDAYKTFVDVDGAGKTPVVSTLLWELVTVQSAYADQIVKDASPESIVGKAMAVFSKSPVYQHAMFRNAKIYRWGDFWALSYEWGDPNNTDEIIVNGERTTVTSNLKDTLQRICSWWRRWNYDGSISLWIDALCINQVDAVERSDQILKMRQIYTTAARVLIMTGPEVEDQRAASDLLGKIYRATLRPGYDVSESAKEFINEENFAAWKGVCEIAGRSYWGRLWIIQEVLLANTAAWVCYGNEFCQFSAFMSAAYMLIANIVRTLGEFEAASEDESTNWIMNIEKVESLIQLSYFKQQGLDYPDLLTLLETGRRAKQLDPRDKIYGVLGMIADSIRITPDYDLPLNIVYRDFVVEVIKATGSLSIIYQRSSSRTIPQSWPSWVPNWSADGGTNEAESISAVAYLNACAAGKYPHSFRVSDIADQLICEGFMIDRVDQLACTGTANEDHSAHDVVSRTPNLTSEPVYSDPKAVREAFWNALTLGRYAVRSEAAMAYLLCMPSLDGRAQRISFLHVIGRFQHCNRNLTIAHQPLSSYFPPWSEAYSELPSDVEIHVTLANLMNAMNHRRFMVTEKGRVGMVARAAQPGDGIFILKGCNAPLILRPAGSGRYCVVGECYVDGVMHGEAMGGLEAGRFKERRIVLC